MGLTIMPAGTGLLSQQIQTGKLPQGFQLLLNAAANYLGLSTREMLDRTQAGKSLAEVAQAQGKSIEGLKDALKSALPTSRDDGTRDAILYRIINAHPGATLHTSHPHHGKSVAVTVPTEETSPAGISTDGSESLTTASASMSVLV